jgi:predicted PurR-regulated permease PerM
VDDQLVGRHRRPVYRANVRSYTPREGSSVSGTAGNTQRVTQTARRAAIATLVAGGIVVAALALWKVRLVLAMLFFAAIIAAAIRPGVDWLARRHVPRGAGLALHYLVLIGLIAAGLSFVVPRALDQVDTALSPHGKARIAHAARTSTGIKHEVLAGLQKRLQHLPKGSRLIRPAEQVGVKAFKVLIGIFFTFAAAAYWIFERDRTVDLVCSLLPRSKRKVVRDTWTLIDLKLGAFVRGQLLLIGFVATLLSLMFWGIGEPYWLLVGIFAGVVEIVPVIGPLVAGVLAIGVGLTSSTRTAILAGICVLAVRLLEDYLVTPFVLGSAVRLSPLLVLVSVTTVGILFSGWAVVFAVPLAAVVATLFDVVLRDRDPAEEDVPAVLFTPGDAERRVGRR